jgi:hypothetical protein
MDNKEKLHFVGSNLPFPLFIKLAKSAEKHGRSLSKHIVFIIKEYFEKVEK